MCFSKFLTSVFPVYRLVSLCSAPPPRFNISPELECLKKREGWGRVGGNPPPHPDTIARHVRIKLIDDVSFLPICSFGFVQCAITPGCLGIFKARVKSPLLSDFEPWELVEDLRCSGTQ